MADTKKINRCNRQRGAALEKWAADFLGMDLVPYSGSNNRFGYGDIRDTKWLGECKNITPEDDTVVIRRKWLDKNRERADNVNKLPFLIFMIRGKASRYIVVSIDIEQFPEMSTVVPTVYHSQVKSQYNMVNLRIPLTLLKQTYDRGYKAIHYSAEGVGDYYIMRAELFRRILNEYGLKGKTISIMGGE